MSISAATLRELYRLGLSDVLDKRVESLEARINFINDKIIIRQRATLVSGPVARTPS